MASNLLDDAKRAISGAYGHSSQHAEAEFASFLEMLDEMRAKLASIGVTFDALEASPAVIEFRTPVGLVQMVKLMVLEENKTSFAGVFCEPVAAWEPKQLDLWSLHFRWNAPWRHSSGEEVRRDFHSDRSEALSAYEAVRSAVAVKLVRNTERLAGIRSPLP